VFKEIYIFIITTKIHIFNEIFLYLKKIDSTNAFEVCVVQKNVDAAGPAKKEIIEGYLLTFLPSRKRR
jgi:hypothetical protein